MQNNVESSKQRREPTIPIDDLYSIKFAWAKMALAIRFNYFVRTEAMYRTSFVSFWKGFIQKHPNRSEQVWASLKQMKYIAKTCVNFEQNWETLKFREGNRYFETLLVHAPAFVLLGLAVEHPYSALFANSNSL